MGKYSGCVGWVKTNLGHETHEEHEEERQKDLMQAHLRMVVAALLFGCVGFAPGRARADDAAPVPEGFVSMFNGKDTTGWDGDPAIWSVKDGVIVGQTTTEHPAKHNTFLIWKGGHPADFEMHAKFKFTGAWGNSGIQFRSKELGDFIISGYQADCDNSGHYHGTLYEERARGGLAGRGEKVTIDAGGKKTVVGHTAAAAELNAVVKADDWNDYDITAEGNHIVLKLNGVTCVDLTDDQTGKAAADGAIALQVHAGQPMHVEFKDLSIKVMKDGKKE
jgi:hypothetical protein